MAMSINTITPAPSYKTYVIVFGIIFFHFHVKFNIALKFYLEQETCQFFFIKMHKSIKTINVIRPNKIILNFNIVVISCIFKFLVQHRH